MEKTENQAHEENAKSTNWQLVISIIVSIVFLYLAVRGVDFTQAWIAVKKINPLFTISAVIVSIATLLAKAARWQAIYATRLRLSFHHSFSILMIGLWANAFLPLRVGEILRAFLIGEVEKDSKTYALGTIFLEKLADLVMLALAVALLLTQLVIPKWVWESWLSTFIVVTVLVAIVLILVIFKQPILKGVNFILAKIMPRWQERLYYMANEGMNSLQMLRQPKYVFVVTLWSLIVWFLSAYNFVLIFKAFNLTLTPWIALFVIIILQLGVAIPSSPGKIGVFHYLMVIGLGIFEIPKDIGLSVGVVSHLMIYVPIAILGLFYLWHENLAWRSVTQAVSRLDWKNSK